MCQMWQYFSYQLWLMMCSNWIITSKSRFDICKYFTNIAYQNKIAPKVFTKRSCLHYYSKLKLWHGDCHVFIILGHFMLSCVKYEGCSENTCTRRFKEVFMLISGWNATKVFIKSIWNNFVTFDAPSVTMHMHKRCYSNSITRPRGTSDFKKHADT